MLAKPLSFHAVNPPGKARAVVIVLHGFGASSDDLRPMADQLDLPTALGVRFVFPQAPNLAVSALGGQSMPGWFDFQLAGNIDLAAMASSFLGGTGAAGPGTISPDTVDFPGLRKATLWIRDLLQSEIDDGVPAERIVLAGFSQGGALALNTGLYYPKPLAGILALSTFLADDSKLRTPRARANSSTPILMCHGARDQVLPSAMGKAGYSNLLQAGYPIRWQEYPMAHEVCQPQLTDISRWLQQVLAH